MLGKPNTITIPTRTRLIYVLECWNRTYSDYSPGYGNTVYTKSDNKKAREY